MIEGSGSRAGSISLTNGSGSVRPKNIWILQIRIRNTAPLPLPPIREWPAWDGRGQVSCSTGQRWSAVPAPSPGCAAPSLYNNTVFAHEGMDPRPAKDAIFRAWSISGSGFLLSIIKKVCWLLPHFLFILSLLDQHESGSTGQPFVSFKAFTTKIYLITNSLGSRQVLLFPEL